MIGLTPALSRGEGAMRKSSLIKLINSLIPAHT